MNNNNISPEKSCCFTGYRPSKFPFPLEEGNRDYTDFENSLTNTILSVTDENCRTFYTGMAMGFDIIAAETVLLLKKSRNTAFDLKLVCAVPFKGQENCYPDDWKERYNRILEGCDKKIVLSEKYYPGCYFKRNHYMVDKSNFVVTWFDGRSGGTKETVDYALRQGKRIINLAAPTQLSII